ncbi:hypothetical protein BH18ACT7_BH18ACT7_17730 [soil metagenome]
MTTAQSPVIGLRTDHLTFADANDALVAMTPDAKMDARRRQYVLWYLVASGVLADAQAQAVASFAEATVPTLLPPIPDPDAGSVTLYGALRFLAMASSDNGRDAAPDPRTLVDTGLQRAGRHIATAGRAGVLDDVSTWALSQLR